MRLEEIDHSGKISLGSQHVHCANYRYEGQSSGPCRSGQDHH